MEKSDSKFLFKKEIPYREFLSVSKILELTVSIVLQDGRTDSILSHVVEKPKEINLAEWIKNDFPIEAVEVEIDDDDYEFFKTVMSATELARLYPYETVFERHETKFFDMAKAGEILLHDDYGDLDSKLKTYDVDTDEIKLSFNDFVKFANAVRIDLVAENTISESELCLKPSALPTINNSMEFWIEIARQYGNEFVKYQVDKDLYPSQINIADHVAKKMRGEGIFGPDGTPLASATIKRHALKGITSAAYKHTSTVIKRSKQGK